MTQEPIIFEDDSAAQIDVEAAPLIDVDQTAMGVVINASGRRVGWMGQIFISAFIGLLTIVIGNAAYGFVQNLLTLSPLIGQIALGLLLILLATSALYILRELWALSRLRRVDQLRDRGFAVRNTGSRGEAQAHAKEIARFYRHDPKHDQAAFLRDLDSLSDADTVLAFTERQLMRPLDQHARAEIERGARQVAVVTALVPVALADLIVVLNANIAMIRRIADIYGGRPGWIGGWRLLRRVLTHLVATGAVAVGDDVIGTVLGGNLLAKLSRRFGEGVINGALTARVGIAAIEVCRPMIFHEEPAPSVGGSISRALKGFAGSEGGKS